MKKQVWETFSCDERRLFDSLDVAIAYLQEVKSKYNGIQVYLDINSWSEEKVEFTFSRLETDAEYQARCEQEQLQKKLEEEMAVKANQRKQKIAQFNALKKELGL